MLETVKKRLEALGYELKITDDFSLNFCMDKVTNAIKNEINWKEIPKELEQVAVDMIVGDFLLGKKTFAPQELENLDLDYAIKEMQEGDTKTVFATGEGSQTSEQRLNSFINYLLNYGKDQFPKFRRLRW